MPRRGSMIAVVLCAVLAAGYVWQAGEAQEATKPSEPKGPRNVILLVGDGMGPQQLALLFDWSDAAGKGETALQSLANAGTVGMLRTGAFGQPVTDSAAAATALASGITTANGFIGVDHLGKSVPTCLEDAQRTGRATGLVTSTRITHATPACFAAHLPNRRLETEIGRQMFTSGVDVMFGGGARELGKSVEPAAGGDPVPLHRLAENAGYLVTTDWSDLRTLKTLPDEQRVLGLFAPSHLPFLLDRDAEGEAETPTLTELTAKALDLLAARGGKRGFFLMVEGGRIDHAGHANDVAGVLGEMREFDDTVAVVRAFQAKHPDTLVVVTADHETGGLCISYGRRRLRPEMFVDMGKVAHSIAADPKAIAVDVKDPSEFGFGRGDLYPNPRYWPGSAAALNRSARWNVTYGTSGHTNTPVSVFALGPGAERFDGFHQNTHVGKLLREFLKK